jgi:protein-L-isoaspartate(D-aspartate) O-methyltransferase
MKIHQQIKEVIKRSPKKMHKMLNSVYDFNSRFLLNAEQEKILEKIIFSISKIDRMFFVENKRRAYDDNALPIGSGQTISQPSTVARMLLLSELQEGDDVLEVGAGSGWNASLISFMCYPGNLISIERINSLIEKAEKNISRLRSFLKQKNPHEIQKISKINFISENIFNIKRKLKKKYDKIMRGP